jgi:hypothetical protein
MKISDILLLERVLSFLIIRWIAVVPIFRHDITEILLKVALNTRTLYFSKQENLTKKISFLRPKIKTMT